MSGGDCRLEPGQNLVAAARSAQVNQVQALDRAGIQILRAEGLERGRLDEFPEGGHPRHADKVRTQPRRVAVRAGGPRRGVAFVARPPIDPTGEDQDLIDRSAGGYECDATPRPTSAYCDTPGLGPY